MRLKVVRGNIACPKLFPMKSIECTDDVISWGDYVICSSPPPGSTICDFSPSPKLHNFVQIGSEFFKESRWCKLCKSQKKKSKCGKLGMLKSSDLAMATPSHVTN